MTGSPLEVLQERADRDFSLLFNARKTTEQRLTRRAELVRGISLPKESTVIFVGSWGRREVTTGSDNDFYVLVPDEPKQITEDIRDAVQKALEQEEREFHHGNNAFRGPGREETFGHAVALQSLLKRIGRNQDSNDNFTQRMLLVLESVGIQNTDLHIKARKDIVANYLEPPIKPAHPPRLFLNDVVRYWRTMCVDFVGKMRERQGQGWGLRNAKLRTTRKMLFASGLLPVIRCGDLLSEEISPFLLEQFQLPPTDRVADAFLALGMDDEGAKVFDAYELFLRRLDDGEVRKDLDKISSRAEADESSLFQSVATIGDIVESGLLNLLFDSELKDVIRRFGIF